MSEEYLKKILEVVDSMDDEQVIVLLAAIANKKGIDTYILKNTPIKMQVLRMDEYSYKRTVTNLGKFNFIKTSNAHN